MMEHHISEEQQMSRIVLIAMSVLVLGYGTARADTGNGTPQERKACARDASRFCREQLAAGDNAVQQCLQQNRERLGPACRKAFQDQGM
jgi:hypothetical protein